MKKSIFLICLFPCLFSMPVIFSSALQAQNTEEKGAEKFTLIFKGEPIANALHQLVQTTAIDLIYDPAIISDHTVFKTAHNKNPEDILRLILDGSGLDFYRLSSGTYVLSTTVRPPVIRGDLTGRVFDQQTGEPLAGANIILADAGGGTSTSSTGFFTIPQLKKGPHEVIVTYVGYKPKKDTVWVPGAGTTSHKFSMVSEPVLVEPLIVNSFQRRLPASDAFSGQLSTSELSKTARFGGTDAIKSLEAVTGIDFRLPLADFNVQGGNAGEHLLRLDGVPIYNPVSMGRLLGAFSPYAIKNITIHKAGFGAPAGSQLSGIIDMKHQLSNSGGNDFLLQANTLNINARAGHRFNIEDGPEINIMLAARGNIWRWYEQPQLQKTLQNWDQLDPVLTNHFFQSDTASTFFSPRDHSYDISYYDLHGAARIKHNEFHQTYISAYRGKNSLQTDLFSENTVADAAQSFSPGLFFSIDRYNWTNTMAKAEHQWLVNSRLDASLSGYITHHALDHNYSLTNNVAAGVSADAIFAEQELEQNAIEALSTGDHNAIMESSVQIGLNYSVSKNYTISGDMTGKFLDYRFNLSDVFYNSVQTDESSFLLSGFVQNSFLLNPKTTFKAGSRVTFVPSRDLVFAEPRLSITRDEPETAIGYLSMQLSGGIYRQFINQFDVTNPGPSSIVPSIRFRVPADYTTTVPKAYHVAGNILLEPTTNWQIRLELYYKWIPARLALNYKNLSRSSGFNDAITLSTQQQFISRARGYAYGTGFSFKKTISSSNIVLKGGYQFNIAEQRIPSRFSGDYQPLPSSQPHRVNASVDWAAFPRVTFLVQWQGIWGRSWAFRKAYYDYLSVEENRSFGDFSFDDPGSDKLPAYSQLNAGISYKQPVKNSSIRFRLDIFNLIDRQNVLDWWLSPFRAADGTIDYKKEERKLSGFMPSLSIKFSY